MQTPKAVSFLVGRKLSKDVDSYANGGSVLASLNNQYMVADHRVHPSLSTILQSFLPDPEPEEKWTPVSAFSPVACNARSPANAPAKAEALFAAECGKRLRILDKWCAFVEHRSLWHRRLRFLQKCESSHTNGQLPTEFQLQAEVQLSEVHRLEQKYCVSELTTSMSGDLESQDKQSTMPEANSISGTIKPTPTVQCSEEIALTPGSGTHVSHG